ncbi:MAG: efflux RND transporter periplasmic adaptor subunit [Lysobacterales bacterium]|jgi:HlyD family secretion protein|nr:MAG: efflux RND transporter periplasmic adaptor subunit [Xanthomonadales bacterium]
MNRPDATAPDSPRAGLDEFLGRHSQSPRARLLRRIALAAALLLLAGLAVYWYRGRGDDAPAYATATVQRGDLRVTVSATGNLQPTNVVEVGSELSGLVTEVTADNNDRVTKGQVLARLDTSRLQDTIAQGQAALQAAQANVAQAEASMQQAQASLDRLEEVRRLSNGKVPSPAELDVARAEHARARAGVQSAQAAVSQARAQLSSDQTQFSKALIRSPVTGVVLSRQIDPGQTVAASFNAPVLFLIAEDLNEMRLEVKVDEADVGQVAAGQEATFQVDAFPGREFAALVERVDLGSSALSGSGTSTSSGSGSSNTVVSYTAALTVDNAEGLLRPGMTATAEIVTSEKQGVLLVPNAALRFSPDATAAEGGRSGVTGVLLPGPPRGTASSQRREVGIGRGSEQRVYVLGPDSELVAVPVRTGDTNGSHTEVTGEGLEEGAAVVTGRLAAGGASGSTARGG